MITISRLAKKHGLARSTLLYYDRIGLLRPGRRDGSGYRYYSGADEERLEKIRLYRRIGLPLEEIRQILDSAGTRLVEALEARMEMLNVEIAGLRDQQLQIVRMLKSRELPGLTGGLTKETWISFLKASGFSDDDLARWHVRFEAHSPRHHREFLEFLGIPEEEIELIRREAGASPE